MMMMMMMKLHPQNPGPIKDSCRLETLHTLNILFSTYIHVYKIIYAGKSYATYWSGF